MTVYITMLMLTIGCADWSIISVPDVIDNPTALDTSCQCDWGVLAENRECPKGVRLDWCIVAECDMTDEPESKPEPPEPKPERVESERAPAVWYYEAGGCSDGRCGPAPRRGLFGRRR